MRGTGTPMKRVTTYKKAFIRRFVLDSLESCKTPLNSHEHGEGRCPHDVIIHHLQLFAVGGLYSYQCGVYACSFNYSGHARASSCGTSKSIVPTSFLCRNPTNSKTLKAESGDKEAEEIEL